MPEHYEPILKMRLDALKQNLNRMQDPSIIRKIFEFRFDNFFNEQFWDELQNRLVEQVERRVDEVDKLQERIDKAEASSDADEKERKISEAWGEYLLLRDRSQEIFLEFHDVIAGLVYRDRNLDDETGERGFDATICNAADELILRCAKLIFLSPALTVPSPREALARTLGRVVRMRYSEWTVWSLPLIAHEFGHVVFGEPEYKEIPGIFSDALKNRLVDLDPELSDALNPGADAAIKEKVRSLAIKRTENELRLYLADAFGTYVMGPAYACAAIHQRLNPKHVTTLGTGDWVDHERAQVILGVLRAMNVNEDFDWIISELDRVWREMVARANPRETSDSTWSVQRLTNKSRCLDEIVRVIWENFSSSFRLCLYTRAGKKEGWSVARSWSDRWNEALNKKAFALPKIDVDPNSMIRDALNAGWYTSLKHPPEAEKIAPALRQLCHDIVTLRFEGGGGGSLGPLRR
jgi:hypothetical protein